jgi:hypothetical protein
LKLACDDVAMDQADDLKREVPEATIPQKTDEKIEEG